MYLKTLQKVSHSNALQHGFWLTTDVTTIPEKLALIHSEVSEALEAYRNGLMESHYYYEAKPEGFGIELADAVIRIADLAEAFNIDLEQCIDIKMRYNKTREYRHGGKKA